jgi:CBS domain-containing protein
MKLQPSPAVKVKADRSIIDCILLMKKLNIGSILVMKDETDEKPIGIFTERDLLKKFDFIQNYENLKLAISSVMTSPVRTLDIGSLDQAAEIMIQNGIRHLPVTLRLKSQDEAKGSSETKTVLAGVISMRDVLKRLIQPAAPEEVDSLLPEGKIPLVLITGDPTFQGLVRRIARDSEAFFLAQNEAQLLQILDQPTFQKAPPQSLKLILDIEKLGSKEWVKIARLIHSDPRVLGFVIAYNPAVEDRSVLLLLKELNKGGKILVMSKPVNVLTLSDFISSHRASFSTLSKEKSN